MTREEAKRRAELYSALAEGKAIQVKDKNLTWVDKNIEELDYIYDCNNYRIKPEPKYRPFKTQEECWNEMLKHQSLGWVRYDDSIIAIQNIAPEGITVNNGIKTSNFYFEECLMNMKFVDGTPFGIKEE